MVVNFDFDAFFDELKATKPPYKCPFKDCEKVYKTYTGIQYHVVTLHKSSNKTAKWHHRQMRCPITPPKSVSSAEAASEGEGEIGGYGEGRLEVEFGENKFIFNDVDDLEIEVSLQKDGNLGTETNNDLPLTVGMNEAEQILKEEPKKPLPVPIFSSQSRITRSEEFRIPADKYIVTDSKDEDQENKLEYLLDEEDKSWLRSMSESGTMTGVNEPRFELAMETMERESAFVTRCENRNHGNNNADADDEQTIQDDNAVCSVCGDGSCHASNVILFCDMCDMAVHQECYGVPYVPEGQWLCRRCLHSPSKTAQCCLCPCPGGALKQTSDGRWAHVLCSAWVPEVNFANPVFLEPIEGLENVPPARWRLVCFLCRRKKVGACIQCHRPNCYTAFHVTCALFAGLHLEMTQRGTDNGPRGIFIPGHSSGNVRKTAYCDLHAPKSGRNNKSLKRDDTTCDPGSDDGGDDSEACEQIDEGRKLLAGDDEGDDDYEPSSVGKSKMDAVTKSRSLMTRIVTSKMKHIVGVLSYPTISQESFTKVSQIFEKDPTDDFMQRLKNYWMLKRLSRNGVPLIRGLQPNLVPKEQVDQEDDEDKKKLQVDDEDEDDNDNDEDEEMDRASTSHDVGAARHSRPRLNKESKPEDETIMLSLTCVNDDDDDEADEEDDNGGEVEMSTITQEQQETINDDDDDDDDENFSTDTKKEVTNLTSPLRYTDDEDEEEDDGDDWDARNTVAGSRKRKLATQDVPKKRMKLNKQFDDHPLSSKSKKLGTGSVSRRLRFYGDPGKSRGTPEEGVSEDVTREEEIQATECSGDVVKRSKRRRKMSSALFDYTYFGSVQRRRSNTKSEEEKKTDQSFSSVTDDSYSKEPEESPKKVLNIKVNHLRLKEAKVLLNVKKETIPLTESTAVEPAATRRGRKKKMPDEASAVAETNGGAPDDELCGAKHLREDLSKVKKILELVTQREECKLEEVRVKTRMYSLKLDPLTPVLTRALDLLQEKDNHQFFAEPVDTDDVSDYLDFISQPMDFGTMRGKIERHEYHSVRSFEEDVDLIIGNCMNYNASGTVYYNAAVRLRNQGKIILNEARKAEEQLNALRKLNSTLADDSDGDVVSGEPGTRSGKLRRGQNKESTNKETHLACIVAKIESVEKKLDSSSGFLRETYSRQLKHLNRQMAALKGRRKTGTSESTSGSRLEMPVLASEDESQNQVNHLNTSKAELMASVESMANGLTPSQTAASPSSSSSSFSISPPSLSPQAIAVSSSPVSSILSSSELPPSDPDCRDKRLRASGNDVEGEFPIPALSSPPDVSSGQEESNAVVCRNPSGDRVTDDERLLESKPASDRSKAGCGWLVAQGTQGSGSRAPSESDLSTNEDRG